MHYYICVTIHFVLYTIDMLILCCYVLLLLQVYILTNICTIYTVSYYSGSAGFVRNSVLSNVRCKYIEAEGCVLINVTAERIIARPGSIIYNYVQDTNTTTGTGKRTVNGEVIVRTEDTVRTMPGEVRTEDGEVIASVFSEDSSQNVLHSHINTDGGKVVLE